MLMVFIFGVLVGMILMCIIGAIMAHGESKRLKKQIDKADKEMEQMLLRVRGQAKIEQSAKQRFKEISTLTNEQVTIMGQLDQPSKGASHSKWKRDAINRLKEIEQEKKDILQSLLNDNIDPLVTVYIDGEYKKIKISELLSSETYQKFTETPYTDTKNHRDSLLRLVKDEDDDKSITDNPSNPTIH